MADIRVTPTTTGRYWLAAKPEDRIIFALPAAGDFSAGLAWWEKLTAPVDPRDAEIVTLKADLATALGEVAAARAEADGYRSAKEAAEALCGDLASRLAKIAAIASA